MAQKLHNKHTVLNCVGFIFESHIADAIISFLFVCLFLQ